MSLVDLAAHLRDADAATRWRLIAEFLEEYRWEPVDGRHVLVAAEPGPTGDIRWDVFLAALAEHLAARDGRAAPAWCEERSLRRFWFPFNTPAAPVRLRGSREGNGVRAIRPAPGFRSSVAPRDRCFPRAPPRNEGPGRSQAGRGGHRDTRQHLDLRSPDEVISVCEEVFPDEAVPARARLMIDDLFDPGHPTPVPPARA
jgi:hypothetical protein